MAFSVEKLFLASAILFAGNLGVYGLSAADMNLATKQGNDELNRSAQKCTSKNITADQFKPAEVKLCERLRASTNNQIVIGDLVRDLIDPQVFARVERDSKLRKAVFIPGSILGGTMGASAWGVIQNVRRRREEEA